MKIMKTRYTKFLHLVYHKKNFVLPTASMHGAPIQCVQQRESIIFLHKKRMVPNDDIGEFES